jgi:exopolyphosphatase/guanosine-5'-triphosphate,3'-diphosphate pyrophosphatase
MDSRLPAAPDSPAFDPALHAAIDVGTNSVKLYVGDLAADGTWRTVLDRALITRLGEGLAARGTISPEAIERTGVAVAALAAEARALGARDVVAVGTAAFRMASNRDEAIDAIDAASAVRIEVLHAEDEARLAFAATTAGLSLGRGPIAVFDTGGGSSQFTFGHEATIEEQLSLPVGAVRYTERFGLDAAVTRAALAEVRRVIAGDLAALDPSAGRAVVGMGGTVTTLVAVRDGMTLFDPARVHGAVVDRAEVERQLERYRTRDAAGRRAIPGLQAARADVILAGNCIVAAIMDTLRADSLIVSDRGLRHGLLEERFTAQAGP